MDNEKYDINMLNLFAKLLKIFFNVYTIYQYYLDDIYR